MTISIQEIGTKLKDREFPRQITIELCAHCNMRCIMCPHPGMTRSKGLMADDLYRRCIDEIAVEDPDAEVWLADHGESLIIGEAIFEKIKYAKSRGLNKVFLNTNGMLLTQNISRGIIESGLDGLFFGLDAATKATHAKIRVGGNLDVILRNIDYLLAEKERQNKDTPDVWVQFIEMDENEHEMGAFVDFWKQKKVGIKLRNKLSWGGFINSPKVASRIDERIPCPWIMNLMHILWEGSVCRCTGDHENNYPMGNVLDSSIASIWRGPLRKERELHLNRRFDLVNDQCKVCIDWKVGAAERIASEL
jgi:MoaA/NifB/PqqE/SkfB family radical SAM enzyme